MHLFTRQATLAREHVVEGRAYAVEIAQYMSEKTGLEVIPWAVVYGAPVGSVSWSTRVDSQAAMGAAQEMLAGDDGFLERSKANARLFTGPAENTIGEFLASSGGTVSVGRFATVVIAQCAGGKIGEAMSWGIDMMEHVAKVTGAESSFVRGIYGPFGTLVWVSRFDTMEALDAANAALTTDSTYLERLDQGGDLFVPGSASERLIQRLS